MFGIAFGRDKNNPQLHFPDFPRKLTSDRKEFTDGCGS